MPCLRPPLRTAPEAIVAKQCSHMQRDELLPLPPVKGSLVAMIEKVGLRLAEGEILEACRFA